MVQKKSCLYVFLLALFVSAFGASYGFSQATATGTLQGTITDKSSAVVAGAQVVATFKATGVTRTATTSDSGSYRFDFVPAGIYTVKVTKGKITVDLPYYGQAYAPPIDPTQSGIQFTTTAFDYFFTPRKKDGWSVRIKPKDAKDVQQVLLTISSEGYTSLQVTSISRQPITFNGYVAALARK